MCGFVAALGKIDIEPGMNLIQHRGIRATIVKGTAGSVGHVRLPIVGTGIENDQPVSVDKWTVAFVGELLDFREESPNMECDTILVVDKWVHHGPSAFRRNDGFWAIAAIDHRFEELHLLCDYLAQKPIYYRIDIAAAASEPAAVAALHPVTPDKIYMASVIRWGYCPDINRTPYAEVKKVLPGQHMVIIKGGVIQDEIVDPLVPVLEGNLKRQIEYAVRRRVLSSDVPVACLLSGGLDSSIVYTLANRYGDVVPYYVSDENNVAERIRVSLVADKDIVEANWKTVHWKQAVDIMQEPIDLGSLVPQVALSNAVKERVCLTGDGADEMFGGYGRSQRYDSQATDVWKELVAWHLPRLDRVMMRNCVEVRSPFLARRVAGLALGLPREQRTGKKILKDLFRGELPIGIADQEKIPLRTSEVGEARTIEMVDYFNESNWRNVGDRLDADRSEERGI